MTLDINKLKQVQEALTDAMEVCAAERYPTIANDCKQALAHFPGLIAEVEMMQERLAAAETYIAESPCDHDIFPEQFQAYQRWQELILSTTPQEKTS